MYIYRQAWLVKLIDLLIVNYSWYPILILEIDSHFFLPQAREKYLALKKGTKADIATTLEDVNSITFLY